MLIWPLICSIFALSNVVYGAKILGIFYMDSYSHFILRERILKELVAKGHEVTMISTFPQKTPIKNYRDIDVPEVREQMASRKNSTAMFDFGSMSIFFIPIFMCKMGPILTEKTLASKSVQSLLQPNETFDLVIMEQFMNDAHTGFAHFFKAPQIVLSTAGSSSATNRLVGNLGLPSYVPDTTTSFSSSMTFLERTVNALYIVFSEICMHLVYFPLQNAVLHRYFPDAPHIYDLVYNTSLVLLNSHPSCNSPRPHLPNMIEIGGFHVKTSLNMSGNLKAFLDDAKEGVIYFSMGANLQSKMIPTEKLESILKSFGKLKMKVLWKWEDDKLPNQPTNVRIEKWLPQPAVLSHPNVKIFITHGGRMSTIETVYYGVPIIGIPIFGDQKMNMADAAQLGYGISLAFADLTEQTLDAALKEIIENPKYAENAKARSLLMRNQPIKPIDNALYWIEYVLANKGAPLLRSTALDLNWYQYFLLDVISFVTLIIVIFIVIIGIIIRKCLGRKGKSKQKIN